MKRLAGLTLAALAMSLIGAPQASAQPAGAYRQSCRDVEQSGPRLRAMCRDLSGRYVPSSLDVRDCASVGNANGQLVCDARGGARRERYEADDDGYGRRERGRRSSPEDEYRRPRY